MNKNEAYIILEKHKDEIINNNFYDAILEFPPDERFDLIDFFYQNDINFTDDENFQDTADVLKSELFTNALYTDGGSYAHSLVQVANENDIKNIAKVAALLGCFVYATPHGYFWSDDFIILNRTTSIYKWVKSNFADDEEFTLDDINDYVKECGDVYSPDIDKDWSIVEHRIDNAF